MKLSRRNFIGLTLTSGFFALYNNQISANSNLGINKKKILILIEMRGGNDGLNTIIPYRNSIYYSQRPNISIKNFFKLNSELALNPMMGSLLPLWEEKKLTFALGVGWPNPNRSHFMAMDQWSTGSESGIGKGWLAKISDSIKNEQYLLSLGPTGSNSIEGSKVNSIHFLGNEKNLLRNPNYENMEISNNRKSLKKFLEIEKFSMNKITELKNKIQKLPSDIKLPKGQLSKQTATALKIINTDFPPSFIQMEIGGFDTHQNQIIRQNRLLKELSENISALKRGTEKLNKNIELNIVVTSEFGRRTKENGSKGTDHGSASVAFLIGDIFKEKFIGKYPDLNNLDERGDLIPNLYPNDLYGYIQKKIWG